MDGFIRLQEGYYRIGKVFYIEKSVIIERDSPEGKSYKFWLITLHDEVRTVVKKFKYSSEFLRDREFEDLAKQLKN